MVPIDKATGNVAIICKRFYASMIVKELGLGEGNSTNTYMFDNNFSHDDVINNNLSDLKAKFGIDNVSLSNHCLPNMYWMPKMHKNPIKARFIVASPKCSIKPLAKAITSAFRIFYKQIQSYNRKSRFFTGVNSFWVVQSNKPVFEAINRLNKRNKAKSITTFDFSTLYTKLPHNKLLKVLHSLIDFCFDGGIKKFILINKFGAYWVSEKKKDHICFSKQDIKDAVTYLLRNCYFTVGSKLFRQIIGIPMGSDPAPFFANLFLYFYEKKWITELKKRDLLKARKLGNIFRFIDDLSSINDNGEFERSYKEIYPEELELGKENLDESEASFLDLSIKLKNNQFQVGLFDKRDKFPFSIVRMPYKSSNIPSNIFYASIGAETLRIARASNNSTLFFSSVKPLFDRMFKQGATKEKFKNSLSKFFNNHTNDFQYVAKNPEELLALV